MDKWINIYKNTTTGGYFPGSFLYETKEQAVGAVNNPDDDTFTINKLKFVDAVICNIPT